jgi:hypothetical protein
MSNSAKLPFPTSDSDFSAWNLVANYITDTPFRAYVLRTAWVHRPKADTSLRNYASGAFIEHLEVRGFRRRSKRILKQAFPVIQDNLFSNMLFHADFAAAVVALWADAERNLVNKVRHVAQENGYDLPNVWRWQDGVAGFYTMDATEHLMTLVESLAPDDEFTQWKYQLAALWLSGGLRPPKADTARPNVMARHPKAAEDKPATEAATNTLIASKADDNAPARSAPTTNTDASGQKQQKPEELEANEMIDAQDAQQLNLSVIYDQLNTQLEQTNANRQSAKDLLYELYEVFDVENTDNLAQATSALYENLLRCKQEEQSLNADNDLALQSLSAELMERPDLTTDYDALLASIQENKLSPVRVAQELVEVIEQIVAYDQERDKVLLKCQRLSEQITNLRLQLDDTDLPNEEVDEELEVSDDIKTLKDANAQLRKLANAAQALRQRITLRKEHLIEQIMGLVDTLQASDQPVGDDAQWNTLQPADLTQKEIAELKKTVVQLTEAVEAQQGQQAGVAIQIPDEGFGDARAFTSVLEQLAHVRRDTELLLLLLCGYISHLQNVDYDLILSDAVIDSLVRGLEALAGESSKFKLFNQLASLLVQHWDAETDIGRAKIQLLALGAEYGEQRLPQGSMWQFNGFDKPMLAPSWQRLWQHLLDDAYNVPQLSDDTVGHSQLEQAEEEIEQALHKENGRYSRASGLKSGRHAQMMAQGLFPELETHFKQFKADLYAISEMEDIDIAWRWPKLKQEINSRLVFFEDDNLDQRYETAITENEIRDNHPFLREKARKLYFDTLFLRKWSGFLFMCHPFLQMERVSIG